MQTTRARAGKPTVSHSRFMLSFFARVFAYDLASNFHAVRLLGPAPRITGPVVIYANHPSWWDAALFVWLSSTMFADRRCAAPMEAGMLRRYPFFGRLGAFAVEAGTFAGAAAFLAACDRILANDKGLLFVNAEGRFRDVRVRTLETASGLAHAARRAPGASFVPLAIEYTFWDERRPNLLLHFGTPIQGRDLLQYGHRAATARMNDGLRAAMDDLATAAIAREADAFTVLHSGRSGINPVYDLWRRVAAKAAGRPFDPAHREGA